MGGGNVFRYSHVSTRRQAETYMLILSFFWLVKRYPSPAIAYKLSQWELDMIHKWALPFEDRADLAALLRQHDDNIRRQHDQLDGIITRQGWTIEFICGPDISPDVLAEFKRIHQQ